MSDRERLKLGDLTKLITKGTTPNKSMGGFVSNGINYIKSESISYDGRIDSTKFNFITEETHSLLKRSQLEKDDILFSMAGAYLGKSAIVLDYHLPANTNQALAIIRLNQSKASSKFINYFFRNPSVIEYVNNLSGQSAQPNINFEEIKSIEISLPPLPEQQAIASVLSSLDDKIDLLHRQNKTLEAMAETLFRQWFIEEAKDDCDEKELGELCEIITKGTTPKQFSDLGINFIKAESISNDGSFIFSKFSKVSEGIHIGFLKRSILKENDLLFSIAGTIGRVAKVTKNLLPANTNQALAILRPKDNINPNLIYCILKSDFFQNLSESKIVHAVQPNLSLGEISKTLISLPSEQKIKDFNQIINPIFDKKLFNSNQIQTLENLRDTLLPKLMSGEIRVQH